MGKQQLSIGSNCDRLGTVEHEFLHAVGFWHEQSRAVWEPEKPSLLSRKLNFVLETQMFDVSSITRSPHTRLLLQEDVKQMKLIHASQTYSFI